MDYKDTVVSLLEPIQRSGIKELIYYLTEQSDFLTAPASTKHHLACTSGLVTHTLNVVKCAVRLNQVYEVASPESVVVAAMSHDFCKINYYMETDEPPTDKQMNYLRSLARKKGVAVPETLNKAYAGDLIGALKDNAFKAGMALPAFRKNYEVKDALPLGHGEKSLFVVNQFITLTHDEALAIRWHMGAWDLNLIGVYQRYAYQEAEKKCKLLHLLVMADTEATHFLEGEQ